MANLSLRQLADLTHLSNPYLTQLERRPDVPGTGGLGAPGTWDGVAPSVGSACPAEAQNRVRVMSPANAGGPPMVSPAPTPAASSRAASSRPARSPAALVMSISSGAV